jgi:site-specific DNA-methyltransferase (cytosine-N4-specific)
MTRDSPFFECCLQEDHDVTSLQGDTTSPGGCPEMAVPLTHVGQITHVLDRPHTVICGDAGAVLRTLPDDYFTCCITSPPYWDTRYSGRVKKLGAELDHRDYIRTLVSLFREVRRTLTPSGTFWLVIGDTYAGEDPKWWEQYHNNSPEDPGPRKDLQAGFKQKDLMGIPWRLAMALQEDGWYLRSDIVWSIPNWPREPVRDRPTRAHDYVFLFTKSEQYDYNSQDMKAAAGRTVWEFPTILNPPIGYAVFPEKLVERCLLAGSRKGDTVLDPFSGSGTVGTVAKRLKRRSVGIELDPNYVAVAEKRIREN